MLEEIRNILQLQVAPANINLPLPFDTPALRDWLNSVGSTDIEIEWSAEWLILYGTDTFLNRQSGYSGPPNKKDQEWPESSIVIGDIHGDPIVYDTNSPEAILFGRHGQGKWDLRPLAIGFPALNDALTIWCEYFYVKYNKDILDADYELLEPFKDDLALALSTILQPHELETFLFALVG